MEYTLYSSIVSLNDCWSFKIRMKKKMKMKDDDVRIVSNCVTVVMDLSTLDKIVNKFTQISPCVVSHCK